LRCWAACTLLCTQRVATRPANPPRETQRPRCRAHRQALLCRDVPAQVKQPGRRCAPEADHCFPPAGRRFAVLALGRKSDLQQPRLPFCCCAAGQGETAPSLASQAPQLSGLWLRALERLSCTTLSGWTLWARQKCRGCALTPLAPLPLQSGRRGCAPADDHPVGRVARAVVPTGVVPPASRHRLPRTALVSLGLGPRAAVGCGLDALAPLCALCE
jgi:hypothetical protein